MTWKGCHRLHPGQIPCRLNLTHNCSVFHTEALKLFKNQLSPYEQSEILGYAELWFLGLEAKKLDMAPEKFSKTSFDDEHGFYLKVMGVGAMGTCRGPGTRGSLERKKAGVFCSIWG